MKGGAERAGPQTALVKDKVGQVELLLTPLAAHGTLTLWDANSEEAPTLSQTSTS